MAEKQVLKKKAGVKNGRGKGKHPNSLKNLKPHGTPGVPNPNQNGSSRLSRAKAALKRFTAEDLHNITSMLFEGSRADIQLLAEDPEVPMVERIFARALLSQFEMKATDLTFSLLNRVHGQSKASHEFTGKDGAPLAAAVPAQIILTMPSNGREAPTPLPTPEPATEK
jgi:hypothetical protein